jgi:hypothetical protein
MRAAAAGLPPIARAWIASLIASRFVAMRRRNSARRAPGRSRKTRNAASAFRAASETSAGVAQWKLRGSSGRLVAGIEAAPASCAPVRAAFETR